MKLKLGKKRESELNFGFLLKANTEEKNNFGQKDSQYYITT